MEGSGDPGATNGTGDTLGHLNGTPGDATTMVGMGTATPGGDKVMVGTHGDVAMEGTAQPSVTTDPRDTLGHLNGTSGDATTVVGMGTATPGGDKVMVGTQSDVAMEGTAQPGVTSDPGDIVGHLNGTPGDATTVVTSVPVTPGSDKMLLGNGGDVAMEGTEETRVLCGPGDTLGHLNEAPGDATTVVAPVTTPPGSDKILVGTSGNVGMEGTAQPGVTGGPGDIVGGVTEAHGDATTMVAMVTATPGSGKVLVATQGDVGMEGTEDPGATSGPGDTLGHLNEAPGDATTMVAMVTATPGSDKILVGTHGDIGMEVTGEPGVTNDPRDTLGHLNGTPGDATTVVAMVTTTPGGDKVLVGTQGDVGMEGTAQPGVTGGPGDIVGGVTEAPGDATTVVAPVTTSPGSGKGLVGNGGDVAMEGTEETRVLCGPGDTLGHLNEVPGDATTTVTSVPVTPGSDKVLVATSGDIGMEVTEDPGVTTDPRDTLGHLNGTPGDATTMVAMVTATPGSDKVLVATPGDVGMEVTAQPGVTGGPGDIVGHVNEAPGDATTVVTPVTTSPGSDKVLVATSGDVGMEVTEDPGVTNDPRDTLGHLSEAPGDATTVVTSVPVTPGSGKILVGTSGDVAMEGTEDPSATGGPGDIVGGVTEAPGDATTTVTSVPVTPGSDKMLVATSGDIGMKVTGDLGATTDPRDTLGHLSEAPGDATTMVAPVTVTSGGDKVLVGTQSDVAMEVTAQPGVTGDPRDTLGHLNETPGDATTVVAMVTTTAGGDRTLLANGGDVAMEGTEDPGVTTDPRDTLGHLSGTPGDATTMVPPVATPPGSDPPPMPPRGDVTMGVAAPPTAPNCSYDSLGRVPDVPKDQSDPTTPPAPMTSPPPSSAPSRGDAIMVAPGGDVMAPPPCRGPAPHGAFPVTAAPPPGLASSAPFSSWPRPLLLLVLPLPLLLP